MKKDTGLDAVIKNNTIESVLTIKLIYIKSDNKLN